MQRRVSDFSLSNVTTCVGSYHSPLEHPWISLSKACGAANTTSMDHFIFMQDQLVSRRLHRIGSSNLEFSLCCTVLHNTELTDSLVTISPSQQTMANGYGSPSVGKQLSRYRQLPINSNNNSSRPSGVRYEWLEHCKNGQFRTTGHRLTILDNATTAGLAQQPTEHSQLITKSPVLLRTCTDVAKHHPGLPVPTCSFQGPTQTVVRPPGGRVGHREITSRTHPRTTGNVVCACHYVVRHVLIQR